MKKIVFAVLCIALAGSFVLADEVWRSSWTATADSLQNLCVNKRGFLHSVVVSSGSLAQANLAIYASSATVQNPITFIDTSSRGSYVYDTIGTSTFTARGLTYTTVGTSQITILYSCY